MNAISMKKSVSSRIKITKRGKLIRRPMGQGHFKAKKTGNQNQKKRLNVSVHTADIKMFRKYI